MAIKKPRIAKKETRVEGIPRVQTGIDLTDIGKFFSIVGGVVRFAVGVGKAMQDQTAAKDRVKHQVKAGKCYRCGKSLPGTWLTIPIDGKDRTVCPSKCQP